MLDNRDEKSFFVLIKERKLNIEMEFSRRLKKSWSCHKTDTGKVVLKVPFEFFIAPDIVKNALLDWTVAVQKKGKNSDSKILKKLENIIGSYMRDTGVVTNYRYISMEKILRFPINGTIYNLKEIFDEVNSEYFANEIESYLRWGKRWSKTSYQAWYETVNGKKVSIITISQLFNNPKIPRYIIKSLMYHEMLHIAVPPYAKDGRRVMHGKEFKAAEERNPYYSKWKSWHKKEVLDFIKELKKVGGVFY